MSAQIKSARGVVATSKENILARIHRICNRTSFKLAGAAMNLRPAIIANRFVLPEDGWVHIATYGNHPHPQDLVQVLDDRAFDSMVANFAKKKKDKTFPGLLVDYDHISNNPGGSSEAAGWIDNLKKKADGLYAHISWTDVGEKAVNGGRFRMVSPVWLRSRCEELGNKKVRPTELDSLACTNDPNIKGMRPITALEQS